MVAHQLKSREYVFLFPVFIRYFLKNIIHETINFSPVLIAEFIYLTSDGMEIAASIYERHSLLGKLFMMLGVSEETAMADACKIEHDISAETFECIKKHYEINRNKPDD